MKPHGSSEPALSLRHVLKPGDLGDIVRLHGEIYAAEQGFDSTFEAYVAEPLSVFLRAGDPRSRLWIAERSGRITGTVAIVGASAADAQLRWYLVIPEARGRGIGTRLLDEALSFARGAGYRRLFLWTVRALEAAARRYHRRGLVRVEERPRRCWGVDVVEERYELLL